MRLLHLANFNSTNIGNGALVSGTERVLREDLGADAQFVPVAWDDYTFGFKAFDRTFVDRINACDALIVGGAVAFNGRWNLANAGMRLDVPFELWSRIERPVVFYGVSYRVWPGQPYHHLTQFRRAMAYVLDSPNVLFSVRNDGTKAWLERLLGWASDRIDVVPDPTLYVPTADAWHPELQAGKANIVVSLNDEDPVYRFGGQARERAWKYGSALVGETRLLHAWRYVPGWQRRKARFLRSLAAAVDRLSRERDVNLILCPHYFDDYRIIAEFLSYCSLRVAYQLSVASGIARVSTAPYFYDLYRKADAVLSMRVHSMTPAVGLGVPCVALTSQSRMTEFMKDAGLQDLSIDVFDPDLAEKVYALLVRALDERRTVESRFRAVHARMRERTRTYSQRIASLLSAARPMRPAEVNP